MAQFKIDGRMKVKTLKENFFNEFGGVLHVKYGNRLADDDATLASIRSNDDAKGGTLTCRASRTVGKFEQELWDVFGIKVNVFTGDDWVAVLDGITLSKIKDIPNQATREIMEQFIAYQRQKSQHIVVIEEYNEIMYVAYDYEDRELDDSSATFRDFSIPRKVQITVDGKTIYNEISLIELGDKEHHSKHEGYSLDELWENEDIFKVELDKSPTREKWEFDTEEFDIKKLGWATQLYNVTLNLADYCTEVALSSLEYDGEELESTKEHMQYGSYEKIYINEGPNIEFDDSGYPTIKDDSQYFVIDIELDEYTADLTTDSIDENYDKLNEYSGAIILTATTEEGDFYTKVISGVDISDGMYNVVSEKEDLDCSGDYISYDVSYTKKIRMSRRLNSSDREFQTNILGQVLELEFGADDQEYYNDELVIARIKKGEWTSYIRIYEGWRDEIEEDAETFEKFLNQ